MSEKYDENNIFAKIIRGEIPCDKVFENDMILAFRDIAPKAPVHILVIPKRPYISFADFSAHASPEEMAEMTRAIGHIAQENHLEKTGYRLITNCGKNAGQEVPHFHVHLLGGGTLPPFIQS